MRRVLFALVLVVFVVSSAAAQELSRADAVAQALGANPQVKLGLEQVALLEGRITEAKADALPDITWTSFAMRSRDPGLLNSPNFDGFPPEFREALSPIPANAFWTTAGVRQTLFSFKLGAALDAARIARRGGEHEVRRSRQVTALDAIRAYNQLLFAIEQLRVIESNVQSAQTHLEFARNRRAAGAATELEELRAEVDLENQRAERERASNLVSEARATLNTVMLRPTGAPIQPTDTLSLVAFDITQEEAAQEAIAARPELQILRIQEEFERKMVDVAAGDAKPSIDFDGYYGFAVRRTENLFKPDFARWSAAVTVSVPLFDGWRTAGRVAQARSQLNSVTHQIAALESQVRLEVQTSIDALALANRIIKAAELNVTQARRAAEMTEANYRLGAATQLDVIDSQQALRQAESIRNQALYVHANARASLRFVMGRELLD
jgi:HAE1 family hydrophobic/amphiphilic exporter-1